MVGTDLNFRCSGRYPIGTVGSGPLSRASSLDPTLLGIFHVISFKVRLQTLFLLNLHLSRIEVGEKYQKKRKTSQEICQPEEREYLTRFRLFAIPGNSVTLWDSATPGPLAPFVTGLSLCAHCSLGLEFPLPHLPWKILTRCLAQLLKVISSVQLFSTPQAE